MVTLVRAGAVFMIAGILITGPIGCRSRGPRDEDIDMDRVSPVAAMDMTGDGLHPRPGVGAETMKGQFEAVYYEFDSSRIATSERPKLEEVARYLASNPRSGVIVEGHTCDIGSRQYNMGLGERRALAARAYLIGLGVDSSRIQTRSYGEEMPAVHGHSDDARRRNRRAEFVIFR